MAVMWYSFYEFSQPPKRSIDNGDIDREPDGARDHVTIKTSLIFSIIRILALRASGSQSGR